MRVLFSLLLSFSALADCPAVRWERPDPPYAPSSHVVRLETLDADGDGRLDLAAVEQGTADPYVVLWRGAGGGRFASAEVLGNVTEHILVQSDLDGDGRPELVGARGQALIVFVSGAPAEVPLDFAPRSAAAGGDEIAVAGAGVLAFFRGLTERNRLPIPQNTRVLALTDFDRDGNQDAVVVDAASKVSVLFRAANGSVAQTVRLEGDSLLGGVATGDIDGDSHPDLAVSASGASAMILHRYAAPRSFTAASLPLRARAMTPSGAVTWRVEMADVTGDGVLDLVANTVVDSNEVVLTYTGAGDGTFRTPSLMRFTPQDPGRPFAIATADLDGDGKAELISASYDMVVLSPVCGITLDVLREAPLISAGEPATLHVVVAGADRGTIVVREDDRELATQTVDANGTATVLVHGLTAGTHALTVAHAGGGAAATVQQHVTERRTVVTVEATPNPSTYGQPVTVKVSHGEPPFVRYVLTIDGVETHWFGATSIEHTFWPAAGTHTIAARVVGDEQHPPSATATITLLTRKATPELALQEGVVTTGRAGEPLWLHVWIRGPEGTAPTGIVQFFDGETLLATVPVDGDTVSAGLRLSSGMHDLRIVYAGDASFETVTLPVRVGISGRRRAVR